MLLLVSGYALHLLAGVLYLGASLVVPTVVAMALRAAWIALLVAAIARRDRPFLVFAMPFIATGLWVTVVQAGSWIFGWTA